MEKESIDMKILHRCPICESTDLLPESKTLDAWTADRTESLTMIVYRCLKCGTITRTMVQRFYDSTNPRWLAFDKLWERIERLPEKEHPCPP